MTLKITQQRSLWWIISSLVLLVSAVGMVLCFQQFGAPLRPGLDFVGGTRLQLARDCVVASCEAPIEAGTVRAVLAEQGLETSVIQVDGNSGSERFDPDP
jgi:preprotein translocase subunit SecF